MYRCSSRMLTFSTFQFLFSLSFLDSQVCRLSRATSVKSIGNSVYSPNILTNFQRAMSVTDYDSEITYLSSPCFVFHVSARMHAYCITIQHVSSSHTSSRSGTLMPLTGFICSKYFRGLCHDQSQPIHWPFSEEYITHNIGS